MSGFEHTVQRSPGETPTGPVRIVPPIPAVEDESVRRRRVRPPGTRTIAVVGVGGGAGTTTVAAAILAVLAKAGGAGVAAGDHVGGTILTRTPGIAAHPAPRTVVADVGPHALDDPQLVAHLGDVVVIVAPVREDAVRAGAEARRAIGELRSARAETTLLVLAETVPAGRAARSRATAITPDDSGAIVLRWDPALSGGAPVVPSGLSDATRAALARIRDAIGG